ncbi:hypothetical protein [Nocardia donostiensis]|uniref:hypothetical protein n=1 Tax=Nocardia donostiensis TaxID=1538463 RepID=UPI00158856C8|nr:hypothetical protein [Nocardia donostiensis]
MTIMVRIGKYLAYAGTEVHMITNVLNWLLDVWGGLFAGSSGYQIPPGTLPFGS